jgi:hypothetical protein
VQLALDLFVVLVTAMAVFQLYGFGWAAIALMIAGLAVIGLRRRLTNRSWPASLLK